MKKRSGISVLAILLVLFTCSFVFYTYSRYSSSSNDSSTAKVAPWKVSVNGTDIVKNKTFTTNDITWSSNKNIADGYIAPGRSGNFNIELDPTGSKVDMDYSIKIDSTAINNSNIEVTSVKINGTELTGVDGVYTGTLTLAEVTSGTKVNANVTITWTDKNTDSANIEDTNTGSDANDISIPVTVTATQSVN